jgi:hypothetical protein
MGSLRYRRKPLDDSIARSLSEVAVRVANEQIKCCAPKKHDAKIGILSRTSKLFADFFPGLGIFLKNNYGITRLFVELFVSLHTDLIIHLK